MDKGAKRMSFGKFRFETDCVIIHDELVTTVYFVENSVSSVGCVAVVHIQAASCSASIVIIVVGFDEDGAGYPLRTRVEGPQLAHAGIEGFGVVKVVDKLNSPANIRLCFEKNEDWRGRL